MKSKILICLFSICIGFTSFQCKPKKCANFEENSKPAKYDRHGRIKK